MAVGNHSGYQSVNIVPLADACVTEWRDADNLMAARSNQCHSLMLVLLNGGSTKASSTGAAACHSLMLVLLNGGW